VSWELPPPSILVRYDVRLCGGSPRQPRRPRVGHKEIPVGRPVFIRWRNKASGGRIRALGAPPGGTAPRIHIPPARPSQYMPSSSVANLAASRFPSRRTQSVGAFLLSPFCPSYPCYFPHSSSAGVTASDLQALPGVGRLWLATIPCSTYPYRYTLRPWPIPGSRAASMDGKDVTTLPGRRARLWSARDSPPVIGNR